MIQQDDVQARDCIFEGKSVCRQMIMQYYGRTILNVNVVPHILAEPDDSRLFARNTGCDELW